MKFHFIHFLLLLSTATVSAQQSEIRSIESFRGLKASEGIDVYLKQGSKESARVEVSGINLQNIITEVSGNYLKIHLKDGRYSNSKNIKVYVTYVEINKLSASSAASIFSDGIMKVKEMDISSSSAGSIEISVESASVKVSASSAGEIDLKGKTVNITVEASSAGEIDAYDLEAENVNANASSGASIKINATKELEAHASSGGSIRYRGDPAKATTNSSSGGSVKKSN
jgi:putative autotransporter adhesin-like protein